MKKKKCEDCGEKSKTIFEYRFLFTEYKGERRYVNLCLDCAKKHGVNPDIYFAEYERENMSHPPTITSVPK